MRNQSIDNTRGLAVFLMFFFNFFYLNSSSKLTDLFLKFEPLIPGIFLFIVGYSFSQFSKSSFKKIISLYLLSAFFFLCHHGFSLKPLLYSSGILQVIGFSLCFLKIIRKNHLKFIFTILLLGSNFLIDHTILGINVGDGTLIPNIAYVFLGNLYAQKYKFFYYSFVLAVLSPLSYTKTHNVYLHFHNNIELISFWNVTNLGLFINISFIIFLIRFCPHLNFFKHLGRHALHYYNVHYIMLVISIHGSFIQNIYNYFSFVCLSFIIGFLSQRFKKKALHLTNG